MISLLIPCCGSKGIISHYSCRIVRVSSVCFVNVNYSGAEGEDVVGRAVGAVMVCAVLMLIAQELRENMSSAALSGLLWCVL